MMEYLVGQKYTVSCAQVLMDDGRVYFIPIFDHLHADVQFGFPHPHYHIDGRFELEPRMAHWFELREGCTNFVILMEGGGSYSFVGIVARELLCMRQDTGLKLPEKPERRENYARWYHGFVGRECKGRRCPHFGTEMLERDGLLVCPMHGLTAELDTLRIIERIALDPVPHLE